MKIYNNIDLYKYSTMRLHSTANVIYEPESCDELIELCKTLKNKGVKYHIISAGSNIIFEEFVQTPIISLMSIANDIEVNENKEVVCGCSVRIQRLIKELMRNSLGGIEYLYSLPSSVGGIVFMNAGRGRKQNKQIADHIVSVRFLNLDTLTIDEYINDKNEFSYRHSPFMDMNVIILSTTFKFTSQNREFTQTKIEERLAHSRKYLSPDKPSCGSVFCACNPIIMRVVKGFKCGGAMFSKKTPNWISNVNNATASDVMKLIKTVQRIHRLCLCKCKLELRIFK